MEKIGDSKYPSRLEDVDYSEYKKICNFFDTEDLNSKNILEGENNHIASPDILKTSSTSSVILCKGVAKNIVYFDKKKRKVSEVMDRYFWDRETLRWKAIGCNDGRGP